MYISSAQAREVLTVLQNNNIPLHLGVTLLCKAKGINVNDLADGGGRSRNYLYQTLTGVFNPAEEFRIHITRVLGVDPWLYAIEKNTKEVNRSN
jgi:transcriptional regulator with XRE-family HTH domain